MTDAAGRPWPLVVRRARPADHAAVMEFASRTWDGWDYIPNAWPHWLAASDGVLLVATAGPERDGRRARDADGAEIAPDRPIAVARVAMLSPTEAWLEGIRVHPRVRGLGVATDLQVAELRWAATSGASVIRYATGERNEASHRLGARHGFGLLAPFRLWQWQAMPPSDSGHHDDDEPSGFDEVARARANEARRRTLDALRAEDMLAAPADAGRWWRDVADDPLFRAGQQLSEHRGWTMQQLTQRLFERYVKNGEVIVQGQPGGGPWALAILHAMAQPAEDAKVQLGLLVGRGDAPARLADEIRQRAGEPLSFWLPDAESAAPGELRDGLIGAGFHPRPWALHVLARAIDSRQPLPTPEHGAELEMADPPTPIAPPAG